MKRTVLIITATVLLFLTILVPATWAQTYSLLIFPKPVQRVDFTYQYNNYSYDQGSISNSSSRNRYYPVYNLMGQYAIVDPSIFVGSYSGSLNYNLIDSSASNGVDNSKTGWGFQYLLSGNITPKKTFSGNFSLSSKENVVQNPFMPAYTNYEQIYDVGALFQHKVNPVSARYTHSSTRTSGLLNNTDFSNDLVTLNATNQVGWSTTTLGAQYNDSHASSQYGISTDTTQMNVNLTNNLNWSRSEFNNNTLTSMFSYQHWTGSFDHINTLQFSTNLNSWVSKALRTGASYTYTNQNSTDSTFQSHVGQGWVAHRLFQSLDTKLQLSGSSYDYSNQGTTSNLGGGGDITYTKKLPRNSNLTLSIGDYYTVTDQSYTYASSTQVSQFEPIATDVPNNIVSYPLGMPYVTEILEVRSNDLTVLYVNGTDYYLDPPGGAQISNIYIKSPSTLYNDLQDPSKNHTIRVKYRYNVNNDITYGTNTLTAGSSATMDGSRYRVYANYTLTTQNLISGTPIVRLLSSENLLAGAEARVFDLHHTFGLLYRMRNILETHTYTEEVYWRYQDSIMGTGVSLQASGRYDHTNDPNNYYNGAYGTTSFNASANLNRQVDRFGNIAVGMYYLNTWGGPSGRVESASVRFNYMLPLGKFQLQLQSQSYIYNSDGRWSANGTTSSSQSNNMVMLQLKRWFY